MYKMQRYCSECKNKSLEVSVAFWPHVHIRLTKAYIFTSHILIMKCFGFYTAEILLNSIYIITRLFKGSKHASKSKLSLTTRAQAVKIELAKHSLQV